MADRGTAALRSAEWPPEGLERCARCPACKSEHRVLLHDDLWDGSFQAAPDEWSLYRCTRCRSAYLDPRPTEETIGMAYAHYYTHDGAATEPAQSARAAIKEALGNGYRNWRYGTSFRPSVALGAAIGMLVPGSRRTADYGMRYLPRKPGRLLDVGCGNGAFLAKAMSAGWSASACEPDPEAAEIARARGADVRQGGIETWKGSRFDAVTMSHVIEHVHDPRATMRAVFDLLAPSGFLYIDTPNIDANTYRQFGADWRGLETPRHLCIFSKRSLVGLLRDCGFVDIRAPKGPSHVEFMDTASRQIAALSGHDHPIPAPPDAEWDGLPDGDKAELLTLVCRRPTE